MLKFLLKTIEEMGPKKAFIAALMASFGTELGKEIVATISEYRKKHLIPKNENKKDDNKSGDGL